MNISESKQRSDLFSIY